MVLLQSVNVINNSFEKDAKCQSLLKTANENVSTSADKLALPLPYHSVIIKMRLSIELANAIRTCIMNELPIQSLAIVDLQTDDRFILSDCISRQLELIPIKQYNASKYPHDKIKLIKTNKTDHIIPIYSHDISSSDTSMWIPPNIIITYLRPGNSLYITFQIDTNCARIQAGKYATISGIKYEVKTNDNEKMINTHKNIWDITIGYDTFPLCDKPISIFTNACIQLSNRVQRIKDELDRKDSTSSDSGNTLPLSGGNVLSINDISSIVEITIDNEYWPMARLIAKYCFLEDPSIPFITPAIIHSTINKCKIRLTHSEWRKLVTKALDKIIADLAVLIKTKK